MTLEELMKKYPDMDYGSKMKSRKTGNKFGFLAAAEANQKKLLELQAMLEKAQNPVAQERIKNEIAKLQGKDAARVPNTYGRGGTKDMQEYMRTKDANRFKPAPTPETPEPILTEDDEKKGFFDRLLSKENRPFLENLGMQLGTNLTAPVNPGENRSLMNQVARSVQGASAQTSAQEKAEIDKLLSTAQAKKALSESSGIPDEYKVAYAEVKSRGEPKEFIISEGKNIKNPAFGVAVANVQARNTSSVGMTKDRIDGLEKLVKLQSSLATTGLGESEKLEITNAINMIKKELGITGSGESGSNDIDLSKKKKI